MTHWARWSRAVWLSRSSWLNPMWFDSRKRSYRIRRIAVSILSFSSWPSRTLPTVLWSGNWTCMVHIKQELPFHLTPHWHQQVIWPRVSPWLLNSASTYRKSVENCVPRSQYQSTLVSTPWRKGIIATKSPSSSSVKRRAHTTRKQRSV